MEEEDEEEELVAEDESAAQMGDKSLTKANNSTQSAYIIAGLF